MGRRLPGGCRLGYVPHHFILPFGFSPAGIKIVRDAPSYCQSGSDRPAKAGPADHFESNEAQGISKTVH